MSKLDGIKAGDRVRVTFEGVVDEITNTSGARVSADADWVWIGDRKNKSDDHFQITRIDPAFKVGEKVALIGIYAEATIIAFLKDGRAVIEYPAGDTSSVVARDISCLTRA